LFYNIHTQQIEDFTGRGLDDMRKKLIRTPLEPFVTFNDDPLRVLRLIRFASRLDFQIVDEVKSAMQRPEIQEALLMKISRERVGIEFGKMAQGRDPRLSFSLMHHLGLYKSIFAPPAFDVPEDLNADEMYTGANILDSLLRSNNNVTTRLLQNDEDLYFGWLVVAMLPWAKYQLPFFLPKGKQQESKRGMDNYVERSRVQAAQKTKELPMWTAPAISAKDALKLSNKFVDILKLCYTNASMFQGFAAQQDGARSSRADLGMGLRACHGSWRIQAFTALMLELVPICLETQGRDLGQTGEIFANYSKFIDYVDELELQDAHLAKPCINGTELATAVAPGRRPGPWLKNATECLVKWQFANPKASVSDAQDWIKEGGLAHVLEGVEEVLPQGKKKKKATPVANE
jgi:tRNA nucleotidyltransferase (CCA-adding enzyme)